MADLGKIVQEFVPVPTMEPVTPLTDLVSVTQGGSAVTALNVSLVWELGQPCISICFQFL